MALFDRKKKTKRRFFRRRVYVPLKKRLRVTSREYRLFRRGEEKKSSWFEFLANGSTKLIKISPDDKTKASLQAAIDFTNLRTTPSAVMSLMVLTIILFAIGGMVPLFAIGLDSYTLTIGILILGLLFGYYFFRYPINLVKKLRIRASTQAVIAILYMVVSMRISPNLERALKFAAVNTSGELAWDLRRLIWDIEMGKHTSASDAFSGYIKKWKPENEEFAESLRLIRDSQTQTAARAEKTLDESLNIILEGTKTRMKHYTQDLRMPVMVIHMMGIILPVLGTIMAPMAAVFLSDIAKPEYFIVGYNIILPIIILWFINSTLGKRPATFSKIDIGRHPHIPPRGSFLLKTKKSRISFPTFPIALIIILLMLTPAVYYFFQNPEYLFPQPGALGEGINFPPEALLMSILIIMGLGFGISSYFILSNFQAKRVEDEIRDTESEFELALFQLGNRIGSGVPIEVAVENSIDDIKDLEISKLFRISVRNIRQLGMTFKNSMFNKKFGALRFYPSRLIRNVMSTIVDVTERGFKYASQTMLTISKYLKNVKETQEYIRDILSETVSSMKFQAYFLTPMITGLIVSMTEVITLVLAALGKGLQSSGFFMGEGGAAAAIAGGGIFGNIQNAISPSIFQLIIGIYLIEIIIILAMFLSKIEHGEDKVVQWFSAGKMLIVGIVTYFVVAMISRTLLTGLIYKAILPLIG